MTSHSKCKCKQCGINYEPRVSWQKFCGRQCRDAHHNGIAMDKRHASFSEIERLQKALRHAAFIISAGKQHPDVTYEWLLTESAKLPPM